MSYGAWGAANVEGKPLIIQTFTITYQRLTLCYMMPLELNKIAEFSNQKDFKLCLGEPHNKKIIYVIKYNILLQKKYIVFWDKKTIET